MSYQTIDKELISWAKINNLTLNNEFAGDELRFIYFWSENNECFQISVDKPTSTNVTVHAWSIETINDDDLHEYWISQIEDVGRTLDEAFITIQKWKNRVIDI